MWPFFGTGSSSGGSGAPAYEGGAAANLSIQAANERRVCTCQFAPGMTAGFRLCRCNTRCTPPITIHPAVGWLTQLWDNTRHVGFKSELLPETTTLDITPKTELTRDLVLTFPLGTSSTQHISPNDWRDKLFPPHRDIPNVHPLFPMMPLVIELIDYTSNTALDLTILTQSRNGHQRRWTPQGGTCVIEGDRSDNWRHTDGVYLPPQPNGGVARRVLYVYDVEECSLPSIRACLAINWTSLQSEIKFASRVDAGVSLIKMPPTLSSQGIRDAKQLFALCVAREIARSATKPAMEVTSLVREQDQSQGSSMIVLPHYFKTAPEARRLNGANDDLMDLIEYWQTKAGHARRCFDATSTLIITAAQLGSGGNFTKPVSIHLRFTYVTVPLMVSTELNSPAAAAAGTSGSATIPGFT